MTPREAEKFIWRIIDRIEERRDPLGLDMMIAIDSGNYLPNVAASLERLDGCLNLLYGIVYDIDPR